MKIIERKKNAQRRKVIEQYCQNDILGIQKKNAGEIIGELLCANTVLKMHSLRLINEIGSDYLGRSYLI